MSNKLQEAARIVREESIAFLADKHGTTPRGILDRLYEGDIQMTMQFDKLVRAGVARALELHAENKISLN